jgi:hypothetical protein
MKVESQLIFPPNPSGIQDVFKIYLSKTMKNHHYLFVFALSFPGRCLTHSLAAVPLTERSLINPQHKFYGNNQQTKCEV